MMINAIAGIVMYQNVIRTITIAYRINKIMRPKTKATTATLIHFT